MPYQQRPVIGKSLRSWVNHYNRISDRPEIPGKTSSEFNASRFALTGVDGERVIAVDTKDAKLGGETKPFIRRDFDSVIGYTRAWPLHDDVAFHPLPPPARRLKTKVHVMYEKFRVPDETGHIKTQSMDPGRVPNMLFGTFGIRHSLRIFFPGLVNDDKVIGNNVHRDYLADFYNLAIQPSGAHCLPEIVRDWPASYATAEFKDRNQAQGFRNTSFIIPGDQCSFLAMTIRREVARHPQLKWAKDFVWGVEVRGIKDSCHHDIDDETTISESLEVATWGLNMDVGTCWHIDVGLEFLMKDTALLWALDQHSTILIRCLGLTLDEAHRLISSSRFVEDPSSHLHSLSGFRCVLGNHGGVHNASYIQAYTTDKSQTYHPEGLHHGKAISCLEAFHGNPPKFCINLQETYHQARSLIDVATRLEVRVPFSKALLTLRNPHEDLWKGMVNYRRELWWIYRGIKIRSATHILQQINSHPRELRANIRLLTMVLGLVYMINSIHSAPAMDRNGRHIAQGVMPLTMDPYENGCLFAEDDDEEGIPYAPGGNIFLRPFYSPQESAMMFEYRSQLDLRTFQRAFGCDPADARSTLWPTAGLPQAHRNHVPTRKAMSRPRKPAENPIDGEAVFEDFTNVMVIRDASWEELHLEMPAKSLDQIPLSTKLGKILDQFASDMFQKMPNPSSRGLARRAVASYSPLTFEGRLMVSFEDIKITGDFTDLFTCLQYARASSSEYGQAIARLFPHKGHIAAGQKRQISRSAYYIMWKELLNDLDPSTAQKVRIQIITILLELPWLPATKPDRMWATDKDKKSQRWRFIPTHLAGVDNPAPRIWLRPQSTNVPFIRNIEEENAILALREEEEEESESD